MQGAGEKQTVVNRLSKPLMVRFSVALLLFLAALLFNQRVSHSQYLLIFSWLIAGQDVLSKAWNNLGHRKIFDENFLMTIATLGAFLIDQWSEAAAVMLFYNLGELIQDGIVNRSRRSISQLLEGRPQQARALKNQELKPLDLFVLGERLIVYPGEKIPFDGVVTRGRSEVNTASLTGESTPRFVEEGGKVLAGFVNGDALLEVEITALDHESVASKMVSLIEAAREKKSKSERLITSFARVYTPLVTIAALLIAFIPPTMILFFSPSVGATFPLFSSWIERGLIFLVIACPCAFIISVPLGYFGGIGAAAKAGIMFKGAEVIDQLSRTSQLFLDKTGTVTKGEFKVSHVEHDNALTTEDFARLVLYAEQHSSHPMAGAAEGWAKDQLGLSSAEIDLHRVKDYQEFRGRGVSLLLDGMPLIAGRVSFLKEHGVEVADQVQEGSGISFAFQGRFVGRLLFSDQLKSEALDAVKSLRQLGVEKVFLLSGDHHSAVEQVAKMVGVDHFSAELLPHEKVAAYDRWADSGNGGKKKRVRTSIFVGDGMNDAALLARADVGIAMGGIGSDLAVEAADVVLMNGSLGLVPKSIEISRKTRDVVVQNIALAFLVKFGFLALGAVGAATLWEAVFADVGVAILALLNAFRIQSK